MGLEYRLENGVLRVTLNAPSRGNSFSLKDAEALVAALDLADREPVKGLLLGSVGRLFCAGGDLDDYARMEAAERGRAVNGKIAAALARLASWPHPTAAVVSGDCFGGGVELVSAFDHVAAVPEAMFGLWQRRIGLTFGWGGGARLSARLGAGRLKALALSARSLSSYEALTLGLIDEIHLKAVIEARALEWLENAAGLPVAPVAGLKTFEANGERRLFDGLWWNDEHRAALKKRLSR